ncbi:MAG: S49 family peptidase, partial [Bacteroides sp.]
ADEKTLMQKNVNNGYDLFLTRCADGRGMDKETINGMAQGRIWTGEKAKELGLVDLLGGIDTALEIAIDKAGVEAYTVMSYPEKSSFIDELLNGDISNTLMRTFLMRTKTGRMMQQVQQIEQLTELDPIQARLPFDLTID